MTPRPTMQTANPQARFKPGMSMKFMPNTPVIKLMDKKMVATRVRIKS
jgi:hypothetical protein